MGMTLIECIYFLLSDLVLTLYCQFFKSNVFIGMVRKHKGIYQTGKNKGRLKPGFRYHGKTKSGLAKIVERKTKWSKKYKNSINCKNPKGFSQKKYCKYGRKKLNLV